MISWRMKLIKLIKFINMCVVDDTKNYTVFAEREYIIQNNDSVYFDFTRESNGLYFVSINHNKLRYTLKNYKRLSEYQKNNFINNYYYFINDKRSIFDINDLIEILSNENFEDELEEQNNFSKSQKEIKEKIKNYQDRKIIESQNSEASYE